ncbi:MAG: penicillin-binding protein 1C [Cyclobacteriaceae bacterium]|nr:penicillin-binding protein 1C [Cyclobacteriaceae bacterium]
MSISKNKLYLLAGLIVFFLLGIFMPIPKPLFDQPFSTVLESREAQLLGARIAADGQWRFPPVDSLPANYITCLLQFEDRHFYTHPGINPLAIFRAIRQNLEAKRTVSGGSTITMQIARMAMGNKPRTVSQKMREIWLALRIEMRYSKKEILALYANNAPFGGNVVGISAASWRYHGRSAFELSWAEAAGLAVLPNAPGLAFPGTNDDRLKTRRNRILKELFENQTIDHTTYRLAIDEAIPSKPAPLPDMAPHLVDRCIKDGLEQRKVKSTLMYNTQNTVNELIKRHHQVCQYKEIHNAAAIVADIHSGEVLAYVGNVRENSKVDHGQQVDIINSKRSPGSLLKPILYALSIDRGIITPYNLLPDIPLYFQGFAPQNFDKQFKGAVAANLALRSSLNVPFVSLLRDYGYEQFHYDLVQLGIKSLDKPAAHYGLSMILGGGEVTLWEVAGVYAALVRNLDDFNNSKGANRYNAHVFRNLNYINSSATLKSEMTSSGKVSAAATWHMLKAMQQLRRPDAESNWQQFGNSQSIAWKTGTSYGLKDAWAIGLNERYLVGIWIGNADGEGRPDLTGVMAAAPLMFRIFETLDGEANFPMPVADVHMMRICRQSGSRASAICPETELMPIAKSATNTPTCQLHVLLNLDESKQHQVSSICYPIHKMAQKPWFVLPPAQAWFYKKFNADYAEPPDYLPGCVPQGNETMEMIYPRTFTKVFVPIEIDGHPGKVIFEAAHRNARARLFWYLDDQFVGETSQPHQMGLFPEIGLHVINVTDEQGRSLAVAFEAVNE